MRSILQLKRVQSGKSMSECPNQPQSGSEAKPDGGFPQIFQSGAKDSNSAFSQQYLRKIQLLPLKKPLLDEKDSKSVKKRLKKGLTRGRNRDIITELSARDTNSPGSTDPWKRYRIKKNANCDFHESQLRKDSQFENEFWTWEQQLLGFKRIKHESLILAQDERWRRA